MSAIEELLKELDEHYNDPLGMIAAARAELAALHAENLQLAVGDYLLREIGAALNCAPDATILQRIAEQARQLDEARAFMLKTVYGHPNGVCGCDYCIEKRAWLAANAPAPQAEQEQTK